VPIVREYALQSILFLAQSMVIMGSSMFTATLLKVQGYPEARTTWPWLPVFVRNWGFSFIVIPAVWALATIWLERHRPDWFSKRETIVTGILLLLALGYLMARIALRAAVTPIRHVAWIPF
jgi:hypothetical protein